MKNETGIIPKGDLVLVMPAVVSEKTPGGLFLTEETRRKEAEGTQIGWVVDAGTVAWQHPRMEGIEVGTQILFSRYQQQTVPVNGVRFFLIRAESVYAESTIFPDYALNAARPSLEVFGANEAPQAA